MEVNSQASRLGRFTVGKRSPATHWTGEWGGSQRRVGRDSEEEILHPLRESATVVMKLVTSRFTDRVIVAHFIK